MKFTLAFCFMLLASAAQAACPAGSTCESYNGQYNYTISGGSTARQDVARWPDNGLSMVDAGIDCTGTTDSSTAFQTAANAMIASGNRALIAPLGCQILLGTGITFTNGVGPKIISAARVENSTTGAPTFIWNGTGGTMFTFTSVDHPTIRGFYFKINTGKSLAKFISIDGAGGGCCISTIPRIEQNVFDSSNQNTNSFVAIELSLTSGTNNENALIQDNDITCSGSQAAKRAIDGVINNSSPTLSSATASFVAGDVGKRVRVSYTTGILDTTILSVTNSTTAVMNANAASNQTGATVHIGESFGVGIHNGPSANAKHQKLYRNRISQCAKGVYFENGSFAIDFLEGGANDVSVYITQTVEAVDIFHYESEADLRFLEISNSSTPVTIVGARFSSDNQLANGFIYLDGNATINMQSSQSEASPATNAVFLGVAGGFTTILTSLSNNLSNMSETQANFGAVSYLTSIDDAFSAATSGRTRFIGLPTSCSGLTTGTLRSNSGVATLCP